MNTVMTWETESSSSEDTFALGERFGKACRGGEVFVLGSDLGGGKTTFVKGLAQGLGCEQVVGSPTFTVSRVYQCRDGLELHHFDFYRLSDPGVVAYELSEAVDLPKAVVAVEWGDIVSSALPEGRIELRLERSHTGENVRQISCKVDASLAYVLEAVR